MGGRRGEGGAGEGRGEGWRWGGRIGGGGEEGPAAASVECAVGALHGAEGVGGVAGAVEDDKVVVESGVYLGVRWEGEVSCLPVVRAVVHVDFLSRGDVGKRAEDDSVRVRLADGFDMAAAAEAVVDTAAPAGGDSGVGVDADGQLVGAGEDVGAVVV